MKQKILKQFVLGVMSSGASMGAMAARDGTLGATSDGDFDIRLSIGGQVRVWGFSDLTFATADGNETADQNICFYSSSERVSLKVSSKNTFRLGTNKKSHMPYTVNIQGFNTGNGVIPPGTNIGDSNIIVSWADNGADHVNGETHASPFVAQKADSNDCAGHENITEGIVFAAKPIGGKLPAGTHTDTVTLEVAAM